MTLAILFALALFAAWVACDTVTLAILAALTVFAAWLLYDTVRDIGVELAQITTCGHCGGHRTCARSCCAVSTLIVSLEDNQAWDESAIRTSSQGPCRECVPGDDR